jgi:ATP-binding cassette subfamily F protein 3
LDEPTNHLDIQSKEVLKQALLKYEGTFLVVSHDREFLDGLTNRIWDIEDQNLKIHHFDVHEFMARKLSSLDAVGSEPDSNKKGIKENRAKLPVDNREFKKKRNSLQNRVRDLEQQIGEREEELDKIQSELTNFDFSSFQSKELLNAYEATKNKLDNLVAEWEIRSQELEEIN